MFKFTAPKTKTYKFTFSNIKYIGNEDKLITATITAAKANPNNINENTMRYVKLKSHGKKQKK